MMSNSEGYGFDEEHVRQAMGKLSLWHGMAISAMFVSGLLAVYVGTMPTRLSYWLPGLCWLGLLVPGYWLLLYHRPYVTAICRRLEMIHRAGRIREARVLWRPHFCLVMFPYAFVRIVESPSPVCLCFGFPEDLRRLNTGDIVQVVDASGTLSWRVGSISFRASLPYRKDAEGHSVEVCIRKGKDRRRVRGERSDRKA
jgi:hypothetical protein